MANKWKDVLNKRWLIANESSEKVEMSRNGLKCRKCLKRAKGPKGCNLRSRGSQLSEGV